MQAGPTSDAENVRQLPAKRGHGTKPKRCRQCGDVGTPDNPLSKRKLHEACGTEAMITWCLWGDLWRHRHESDFGDQVAAFLAEHFPGSVATAFGDRMFDRVA